MREPVNLGTLMRGGKSRNISSWPQHMPSRPRALPARPQNISSRPQVIAFPAHGTCDASRHVRLQTTIGETVVWEAAIWEVWCGSGSGNGSLEGSSPGSDNLEAAADMIDWGASDVDGWAWTRHGLGKDLSGCFPARRHFSIGIPDVSGRNSGCFVAQSYIPTFLHSYNPAFLHSYIPTILHSFIPTILHSYNPTILHSYNHTFLHYQVPSPFSFLSPSLLLSLSLSLSLPLSLSLSLSLFLPSFLLYWPLFPKRCQ